MKKHILYAFLFCSLFSLAGCLQEKETSQFLEKSLTVQQAKELYEAAVTVSLTKAIFDGEQTNMFHRESYSPNWKVALPTRTGDVESIDIPVNDERHYYVTTQDGQGFYLTRCHHSITIVRSTETKATGVYHHFFIPFRDSRNKYRDTYDGELYRNFHNNGFRDDFTGLEIYSDIEGRIVKLLRYYRGKLYTVLYAGNGAKDKKRIHYNLCYYILKAYSIRSNIRTKDGGHFICPKCECDLYESESGYYYCTHCPWSELDFYNQEIDETIIYGEGGGSNNGGSGNNNNLDPNLPDPNTGIGGSSGSGNGNSGITPEDIPDFVELDSTALQKILPTLILIMEDCAGTALINAISDLDIRFHYVSDLWDLAHLKRTAHIRSINGQIVDTHYVSIVR